MNVEITRRDYSLIGRDTKLAEENGLATAEWYHSPIPRKRLKELMQRSDGPAIRDTHHLVRRFVVTACRRLSTLGHLVVRAVLRRLRRALRLARDSRWHECGHGTAFKTRWMNDVVYQIASFMILREPTVWRWSHTRHHTDTIIVGRDPEIAVPRPPRSSSRCSSFFASCRRKVDFKKIWSATALGRLDARRSDLHPREERRKVYRHRAGLRIAIYRGGHRACASRHGASCR